MIFRHRYLTILVAKRESVLCVVNVQKMTKSQLSVLSNQVAQAQALAVGVSRVPD